MTVGTPSLLTANPANLTFSAVQGIFFRKPELDSGDHHQQRRAIELQRQRVDHIGRQLAVIDEYFRNHRQHAGISRCR